MCHIHLISIFPVKRIRSLVIGICTFVCGTCLFADRSPETLVNQLSSSSFQKRAAAEAELLKYGAGSLSAVAEAAHSKDVEVRLRAQRLLALLHQMAIVENKDLILNKPWTLPPEFAPGWELFHQFAGDGLASRQLYLEMLQEEPKLMLSLGVSVANINSEYERRCADLRTFVFQRSGQRAEPATVATLLFVSIHPDCQPSSTASTVISHLLNDPVFNQSLTKSAALQSLLSAWIMFDESTTAQTRLAYAAGHNLVAGIVPAHEILNAPFERSKTLTQNAILFLAKFGSHPEVDRLEELLENEEVLYPSYNQAQTDKHGIQVRDVALLGLLFLTEQDIQEYKFSVTKPDRRYLYAPNHGGFTNDNLRKAALERWQKWRSAHPKSTTPSGQDASEGPLCRLLKE